MKTVTQHIRDRLLKDCEPPTIIDAEEMLRTQWSCSFERYMRNRMAFGGYRYGTLDDNDLPRRDMVGSIIARANRYLEDGNQEHLVDIANLAMVEFCRPSHPNPHFSAVDDGEHVEELP